MGLFCDLISPSGFFFAPYLSQYCCSVLGELSCVYLGIPSSNFANSSFFNAACVEVVGAAHFADSFAFRLPSAKHSCMRGAPEDYR